MALQVGSRLGHYDVTALLGEGGMGQVWQAHDRHEKVPTSSNAELIRFFGRYPNEPAGKRREWTVAENSTPTGGSPRCLTSGKLGARPTIIAIVP